MQPESEYHHSRRDWMMQVLCTAGASVFGAKAVAEEHSHQAAISQPANGKWRPTFFSEQQNAALVSISECIIPGSSAASCNRIIDLILTLETEKTRKQMLDALAAFDAAARSRNSDSFRNLPAREKNDILAEAANGSGPLAPHFAVIKEWTADAYWSSQEGMRELGWNGRIAWTNFEGCPHGDAHTQS